METVYLGLGSNLGNREENLKKAICLLEQKAGEIIAVSEMRSYRPWGFKSTNDFLNVAVAMRTCIEAMDLLDLVLRIEFEVGRVRQGSGYSDRVIDIDILFYGSHIIESKRLVIPHPLLHKRLFVLEPMSELAYDFVHPVLGKTISKLLASV